MLLQAENATFESELICQDLLATREILSKRVAKLEARLRLQEPLTINTSFNPSQRGKSTESCKPAYDYPSIPSEGANSASSVTETEWEVIKHQSVMNGTSFSGISAMDTYESPRESSAGRAMWTPTTDIGSSPSCTHGKAKRIPIAVVTRGYQAKNAHELSIDMGERLKFLPGANLQSHHGWIWCEKGRSRVQRVPASISAPMALYIKVNTTPSCLDTW
ncbi:hypothetical protein B0J17DRAFT_721140 [Rhizoctonia solani]|nr:hypothetical protein B0J17DRAFT_721140 [Rhizoctonia solani]